MKKIILSILLVSIGQFTIFASCFGDYAHCLDDSVTEHGICMYNADSYEYEDMCDSDFSFSTSVCAWELDFCLEYEY